jgi:hypothetical protein
MLVLPITYLFIASLFFRLILHIFQIKEIEIMCYQCLIHYAQFSNFEILDYENVKPLKSKFPINSNLASKTYF